MTMFLENEAALNARRICALLLWGLLFQTCAPAACDVRTSESPQSVEFSQVARPIVR